MAQYPEANDGIFAKFKAERERLNVALDNEINCVERKAKGWLLQKESAAVIVDAALAACSSERAQIEDAYISALLADPHASPEPAQTAKMTEDTIARVRGVFIGQVLEWRTTLEKQHPDLRPPWR